jgi:hypothetical protein
MIEEKVLFALLNHVHMPTFGKKEYICTLENL